jgi:hypothetical protein
MTFCESCAFGKQHKEPFPMNGASCITKVLGFVHLDVWGPTKITSFNGSRYFITFTDDFSRNFFVSFMNVLKSFKNGKILLKHSLGRN